MANDPLRWKDMFTSKHVTTGRLWGAVQVGSVVSGSEESAALCFALVGTAGANDSQLVLLPKGELFAEVNGDKVILEPNAIGATLSNLFVRTGQSLLKWTLSEDDFAAVKTIPYPELFDFRINTTNDLLACLAVERATIGNLHRGWFTLTTISTDMAPNKQPQDLKWRVPPVDLISSSWAINDTTLWAIDWYDNNVLQGQHSIFVSDYLAQPPQWNRIIKGWFPQSSAGKAEKWQLLATDTTLYAVYIKQPNQADKAGDWIHWYVGGAWQSKTIPGIPDHACTVGSTFVYSRGIERWMHKGFGDTWENLNTGQHPMALSHLSLRIDDDGQTHVYGFESIGSQKWSRLWERMLQT